MIMLFAIYFSFKVTFIKTPDLNDLISGGIDKFRSN